MIGFFDSGFGGMSILREVRKKLPEYNYLYLGDTARLPYGNRSQEVIYKFSLEAVEYLFKQGCQLIIIACNTVSAEALPRLQQEFLKKNYPDRRILGVIRPTVEKAIQKTKNKKIGVLATRSTIDSGSYIREFKKLDSDIEVFQQEAPLLVPLIEEGWARHAITKKVLRIYLRNLKLKKIDVLIPGCTHYPLLHNEIQAVMGKSCHVLKIGEVVGDSLKDYLDRHPEIDDNLNKEKKCTFLTTDDAKRFDHLGSRFWGKKINSKKVDL